MSNRKVKSKCQTELQRLRHATLSTFFFSKTKTNYNKNKYICIPGYLHIYILNEELKKYENKDTAN